LKLKLLRKNPNVCFEVDRMTDFRNWESIIIYGQFQELDEKEIKEAREKFFDRMFPLMTNSTIHTHEHLVNAEVDDSTRVKQVMYRIKIKKITGRFEKQ
jgi:nitroimidazol reductase NimA-like FMN-containing flavoprotein (pyridoxamine 5'-phosphate oxidase superfamily)